LEQWLKEILSFWKTVFEREITSHTVVAEAKRICADTNSAIYHPQQQGGKDPTVQYVVVFAFQQSD